MKLPVGILLLVVGFVLAAIGLTSVGEGTEGAGDASPWFTAIPIISGLSLAIGALLLGLSLGNWKHPRSHIEPGDEIVDPEGYRKVKHV